MKILIISSEVFPFSKTGGLADVAGSLPIALRKIAKCDVRVISPFYKMVKDGNFKIEKLKTIKGKDSFELLETEHKGIKFYFIGKDEYYNRLTLYGSAKADHDDNAARFSFFCRAALTSMAEIGFYPDVIHTNDWQTALVPLYKNTLFDEKHPLRKTKVLFSIHNLVYQGLFAKEDTKDISLPDEALEGLMHWGRVSFIKSGILYADSISTVSKKYAKEILTEEYGAGLDEALRKREKDIYGILNGVDYSDWHPETDRLIPVNYDANALGGKLACKLELLREMKIDITATAPLIGSVGRLVEQKGIDLIVDSIDEIIREGGAFVLLGTGQGEYETLLKEIAGERKGKVGVSIGFNNRLAHMIEAGSDMFIMPSRYEPCGLNQMYSLKYGTIPIVRATGGLDDTILDYSKNPEKGNGFKFEKAIKEDFIDALKRAMEVFKDKEKWQELERRAMAFDFSWEHQAREYIKLYEKAIERK